MIKVGLTGGIGSGKTTIANFFKELGVPVYIADAEAKKLMQNNLELRVGLIDLFGDKTYKGGELNRSFIASKIFNNKRLLQQMNALVHPKVGAHFEDWLKRQKADYIIKEAAIIFEQHMQNEYDLIITVIADKELRIDRVLSRDDTTRKKVEAIIENQMTDADKMQKSDFVIKNHELKSTKNQIHLIHKKILARAAKNYQN